LVGAAQDLDFVFELADPSVSLAQLLRLLGRATGDLSSIDAVLLYPGVNRRLRDVEIDRGLSDCSTRFDESNRSSTKLWWIGTWHCLSLS
jgi:hypothetical protein